MKKNYVYVVAPLAGLLVFSGIYLKYSSGYEARMAETKKIEHDKMQAKLDAEARDRLTAATQAKEAQDRRKAEKAAKEQKDAEDQARRERASQARYKAQRDAEKLAAQVARLKRDIDAEKKEIAVIEDNKKRATAEQVGLLALVKATEDGSKSAIATLEKISDADAKWAQAVKDAVTAARAAAAKK